jgi:hypothetical protein
MLVISVAIASLIIPAHHQLEHKLIDILIKKNNLIRNKKTEK